MKTLIVLDDSSRVGFGGGQKMTLMVCGILKDLFKFRFIDFSDTTRYGEYVKQQFGNSIFLSIGDKGGYNGRLKIWSFSVVSFFLHGKKDVRKILEGLEVEDCVTYATGKRFLLYAYLLNKIYGIPYIYHAHLVENPQGLYYSIFKKIVKKASAILCVSHTVMDSIVSDKKQLVYNPSLNNKGVKKIHFNKPIVVAFVGSLIHIKGVEYFIDAAMLCEEDVEFRVYGEGPLKEELMKRAQGKVRFMGFCPDMVTEYYENIDILVVSTIIQEALPLVAVDAKSVGIPIVTTSPGGQAEIVEDGINGFHVPMKDAGAIAEKVNILINDRELYERMSMASFNSYKAFEYDIFVQKIRGIFKDLS